MSDDPSDYGQKSTPPITVTLCGSRCEHVWDGPEIAIAGGLAVTCSKCGCDALTDALWNGP